MLLLYALTYTMYILKKKKKKYNVIIIIIIINYKKIFYFFYGWKNITYPKILIVKIIVSFLLMENEKKKNQCILVCSIFI